MLLSPSPRREERLQRQEARMAPGSRVLPASGIAFEPTSIARLVETMRELADFAPHVKTARDAALAHAAAVEAHAARLRAAMGVPLPRVWSPIAGSPSQVEPKKPSLTHDYSSGRVGGGSVDEPAFTAAAAEVSQQLRVAVAAPLERWLDALDVARARLASCERARMGLDGARRQAEEAFAMDEAKAHAAFAALRDPTAAAAGAAVAGGNGGGGVFGGAGGGAAAGGDSQYGRGLFGRRRARRGLGAGGGALDLFSAPGATTTAVSAAVGPSSLRGALFVEQARAAELEEAALRRAQHERALGAIRASFEEQERLAFEMLGGLARDTARLKSYYVAALLASMHGAQRLALALGAAKLPLPGFALGGAGGAGVAAEYGRIGPVDEDLLAVSPLARELARGRLPPSAAEAEVGADEAAEGAGGAAAFGAAARRPWPVVVRRAVATPMSVGADTMLEGRAPVPRPTATGGAGQECEAEGEGASSALLQKQQLQQQLQQQLEQKQQQQRPPLAATTVTGAGSAGGGGGIVGSLERGFERGAARGEAAAERVLHPRSMAEAEAGAPAGPAAAALLQRQQQQPAYSEPTATAATTTQAVPAAARSEEAAAAGGGGAGEEGREEEAFDEARSRQTWTPASSLGSHAGAGAQAKEQPVMGAGAATAAMHAELA